MAVFETINYYASIIPWWAVITAGVVAIFHKYFTWNFGYWERQNVKAVKPWPVFGSLALPTRFKAIEYQDQEAYQKYGRVVGIYEGRKPVLLVGNPELLRTVLVKDFHVFQNRREFGLSQKSDLSKMLSALKGEKWKTLRSLITPTFTTGKMKQMVQLINDCGEQMIKHLKSYADNDETIEAKEWFSSYTIDVIATCAFGTKIDSVQDRNSKFVEIAAGFGDLPKWFYVFSRNLPKPITLWLFKFLPTDVLEYLKKVIRDVTERRKTEQNPRKDLLQLLLEAKVQYEKELEHDTEQQQKDKLALKRSVLTSDHISVQAISFLLAGFQTTAVALSFAAYFLALNEDVQEKLSKEILEILSKNNNVLTYEAMVEMKYLDMVVAETLRIAPPGGRLERSCGEDGYMLGDAKLQKGMLLVVPVFAVHHDPEFFPSPEVFDPERFSAENRKNRNPYTYLSFGYGPRNCIGLRFALMKTKIAIIHLLKEFRIKTCSETQVPYVRKENTLFFEPVSTILKLENRKELVGKIENRKNVVSG